MASAPKTPAGPKAAAAAAAPGNMVPGAAAPAASALASQAAADTPITGSSSYVPFGNYDEPPAAPAAAVPAAAVPAAAVPAAAVPAAETPAAAETPGAQSYAGSLYNAASGFAGAAADAAGAVAGYVTGAIGGGSGDGASDGGPPSGQPEGQPSGPPPPGAVRPGWQYNPNTQFCDPAMLPRKKGTWPTSPKDRTTLGTYVVRIKPPRREKVIENKVKFLDPILEDYRVPPNHGVILVESPIRTKLAGSSSAKRRKGNGGTKSNAMANFYDISYMDVVPKLPGLRKFPNDVTLRFGGVAYEGADNPEMVRRNPNTDAMITLTPSGIVTMYCRTDILERDNVQVGDRLEWHPVGCRMWWADYGRKFETFLVRKFSMDNYVWVGDTTNSVRSTTTLAKISTGDHMTVREVGQPTADGKYWDMRVPATKGVDGKLYYDPSKLAMPPLQTDPNYEWYLKFIGADKDTASRGDPSLKMYFDYMKKLGIEPIYGSKSLTTAEKSQASKAMMTGIQLATHLGLRGAGKIPMDAGGQFNWSLAPGEMWIEVFDQLMNNGVNPDSMEWIYPDDFAKTVRYLKSNDHALYTKMVNTGILYPEANPVHLDLTKLSKVSATDANNIEHVLMSTYGDGTAKFIFAAIVNAMKVATQKGSYKPAYGSSHTIYTWDLVYALAKQLEAAEKSHGRYTAVVEDIKKAVESGDKDAVDAAMDKITHHTEFRDAIVGVLQQPIFGFAKSKDELTVGDINKAAEKLGAFEGYYTDLFKGMGIQPPAGGVYNMEEGINKILSHYNAQMSIKDTRLLGKAPVDVLIAVANGDALSLHEQAMARQFFKEAREKDLDVDGILDSLRVLKRVSEDADIVTWTRHMAPIMKSLSSLEESLKDQFRMAFNAWHDLQKNTVHDSAIVHDFARYVRSGATGLDKLNGAILPELLKHATEVDVGSITVDSVANAMNILTGGAAMVSLEKKTYGNLVQNPLLLATFEAHISVCSAVPHIPVVYDQDTFASNARPPERQLANLLINSNVCGHFLALAFQNKSANALKIIDAAFRTIVPSTSRLGLLVNCGPQQTAPAAETAAVDILNNAKAGSDTFASWVNSQAQYANHKTGYVEFAFETNVTIDQMHAVYEHHRRTGSVRLCGLGFLKRYDELQDKLKPYKEEGIAGLVKKYGGAFKDDSAALQDLETLYKSIGQVGVAISAETLYTDFGAFFPEPEEATKETTSRAACYCIDHPYALAFEVDVVDPGMTINEELLMQMCSVMACADGDSARKFERVEAAALHLIHPSNTSAALAVLLEFASSDRVVAAQLDKFIRKAQGDVDTRVVKLISQAAMLDLSSTISTPEAHAARMSRIRDAETAQQHHLIDALRTTARLSMGLAKFNNSIATKTTGVVMSHHEKKPFRYHDHNEKQPANPYPFADPTDPGRSNPLLIENPCSRVFGTLLELRENSIRVILDSGLSAPPVHH